MQAWWSQLSAEKQLKFRRYGIAAFVIVLLTGVYYASGSDVKPVVAQETKRDLTLGTDLLEDDIRTTVNRELKNFGETVSEVEKKQRTYEALLASLQDGQDALDAEEDLSVSALQAEQEEPEESTEPRYPPPPPLSQYTRVDQFEQMPPVPMEPKVIGGIGRSPGEQLKVSDQSKKKNTVYMPPSFMPAVLLTGLNALTSELGDENPEPVMLRVQAPAVLPNNLKANLKGCFVVANATGNLAQERVNLQLVSLSCMSLDGKAVIDQEVQGFVADSDGKRGLTGIVVTKMGAHVARMVAAGIFEGFGNGLTINNTTTATSPLGTTQVIDPDQVGQTAAGQGLKSGASAIQKLFLDLAKQTTPVIEVGAAKKLTAIIQKGVELEIRDKTL